MSAFLGFALVLAVVGASNVVVLDKNNFDEIINGDRAAFVEFYAPWCGHCKSLAPVWDQLGESYSHVKDVVIAKVDADAEREIGGRFGISGFPTLKFFPKGQKEAEEYSGGRTVEDFVTFLNGKTGANGRVKTVPSDVVVLNDDNFDSIVMDSTKDVLVEFYAPWCGHCKSLAPVYEKVGTTYKNDKSIVVAKMDADHFRVAPKRYDVTGFPTLKWFPKADKKGEDYNGGRTELDFVNFINEKTGAQRVVGGALNPQAGRVAALDALAKDFSDESKREGILAEASKAAGDAGDQSDAALYVSIMKKIIEKGNSYATGEVARLDRMLASGNVKADKLDAFYKRKNVLQQFQ